MGETRMMRSLIGAYTGEVREFPTLVAQQLERTHRAQHPDLPWEPSSTVPPEIDFEAHNELYQERKLAATKVRHDAGTQGGKRRGKGLSSKDLS